MTAADSGPYSIDALTDRSPGDVPWSRVNSAEALPGVITPITWSYYGRALELGARVRLGRLGIVPRSEIPYPENPADRLLGIFHGRLSVNVNVSRRLLSGLPGVTGAEVERDLLGSVREDYVDPERRGRSLLVLAKAPRLLLTGGREAARMCPAYHEWWREQVAPDGPRGGRDPRALLSDAVARFRAACNLQVQTRMVFQGAAAQLTTIAEGAGRPEAAAALLSGAAGTEEAEVADAVWELAHGRGTLEDFLARHGFHGPNSGELSSRSWREDPQPLERVLAAVRDSERPADRRARAAADRAELTARILADLPRAQRTTTRVLLQIMPRTVRALERTKTSFLTSGDAGRAAVRAIGDELVAAGVLEQRDDAFHLFGGELLGAATPALRARVDERKELRERCLAVEIPETWEGQPEARPVQEAGARADVAVVTGLGASPGVVEGPVRIVRDAADDVDIQPGDILVCPTTDPSWLALMTVASALVIDMGAAASHGAIVARELGVPCVIGTGTGTADLHEHDIVRVDGSAGVVEVLRRSDGSGRG